MIIRVFFDTSDQVYRRRARGEKKEPPPTQSFPHYHIVCITPDWYETECFPASKLTGDVFSLTIFLKFSVVRTTGSAKDSASPATRRNPTIRVDFPIVLCIFFRAMNA